MVAMIAASKPKRKKSTSEEAIEYEAALRRAINDLSPADIPDDDYQTLLTCTAHQLIPEEIASRHSVLSAMKENFLDSVANAVSITSLSIDEDDDENEGGEDDVEKEDRGDGDGDGDGDDNDEDDEAVPENETENDDQESGKDDETVENKEFTDEHSFTTNKRSFTTQMQATDDEKTWLEVRRIVLQSLDKFLSVHVIGARSKASAFFDKLVQDTRWFRIAIVAGSTVAEASFLAVNSWGGAIKTLTVIDISKSCPGQDVVKRLAWQTQAPVRYAPLCAAHKALENVDVVVMGAQEVMMNGHVIVSPGGGFIAQAAQEIGVPLVITTQSIKFSQNVLVDWFVNEGDVLKPREIQTIVTELDTNSWRPSYAPNVLKKMAGH